MLACNLQVVPLAESRGKRSQGQENRPSLWAVDVEVQVPAAVGEKPLVHVKRPLVMADEYGLGVSEVIGPQGVKVGPQVNGEVLGAEVPGRGIGHLHEVIPAVQEKCL